MIDEGVFYYVLGNLRTGTAEHDRFKGAMATQMAAIAQLPEFGLWVHLRSKTVMDHYHLVLAAHLLLRTKQNSAIIEPIVTQAQQVLAATTHGPSTVRLTIAAFLSHSGVKPAADLDSLLTNSMIEGMTGSVQPMILQAPVSEWEKRIILLGIYALVHEVIALTDFGRLPPPPWLAARQEALVQILMNALHWARREREIDLLSELVVVLRFLDVPLNDELRSAKEELLAHQRPDGSWGAFDTPRQNKKRHAVLTSLAALRAFSGWITD